MGAQKVKNFRHNTLGKMLLILAVSFVLAIIGALLADAVCRLVASLV